jgi:hypothetical protein
LILSAGAAIVLGWLLLRGPLDQLFLPGPVVTLSRISERAVETVTPWFSATAPANATPIPPVYTPTDQPVFLTTTAAPASSPPTATLLQNANCRIGPGMDYRILVQVPQGTTLPILGQDPYQTWWLVQIPDGSTRCWIAAGILQTAGDTSAVPQVEPPPLGCLVKGNDRIDVCLIPCPADVETEGVCSP